MAAALEPMTLEEWCATAEVEAEIAHCDECGGLGEVKCYQCQGTGRCTCDCDHQHECGTCKGLRTVECSECQGAGRVDRRREIYKQQLERDRKALERAGLARVSA